MPVALWTWVHMEEAQLKNVDVQKQNELWILLPGARKLNFPFNTLAVGEANIIASGKQIQCEGLSIQAGSKNGANESGVSWSHWLLLCISRLWAVFISCEAWDVLLQMLSQATAQPVQIIPFDHNVEKYFSYVDPCTYSFNWVFSLRTSAFWSLAYLAVLSHLERLEYHVISFTLSDNSKIDFSFIKPFKKW